MEKALNNILLQISSKIGETRLDSMIHEKNNKLFWWTLYYLRN